MAKRSYRSGGKRQPIGDEKEGDWAPPLPPVTLVSAILRLTGSSSTRTKGSVTFLVENQKALQKTIKTQKEITRNGKWR